MNESIEIRGSITDHDPGSCVAGLVRVVGSGTGRILAPYGLPKNYFALLRPWPAAQEWSATQLAQTLPCAKSSIDPPVTKLVDMGLVQSRRLLSDRRVGSRSLTDSGVDLTQDPHSRVQEYDARPCTGAGQEQMAAYVAVNSIVMANYAALARTVES